MFPVGMEVCLDTPHIFAPVGQEHYLLIFWHPLRLPRFPQAPAWFLVIALHQAETFGWRTSSFSQRGKATTLRPAITSNQPSL
jgi:hypothetical protein